MGLFGNEDEARRIFVGERAEQDRVYDAEDRGVCADAERESNDRDDGEGRMLPELA